MGKLTLKDKLNVMKEIDISNKHHVEDWKRENMKVWIADYGFIDRDGIKHDEKGDEAFPYGSNKIQIEALDIQEALKKAKEQISAMGDNRDWQHFTIYDVGICNQNIW